MRGRKPALGEDRDALTTVPNPPAWLSKDARAEWRRVAPILTVERRILTAGDLASLANYCAAVGLAIEAQAIIRREGMTFMGASGPKKHPAVGIQNDAMTQARQLAAELGLTPVSRSRPAIREENDDDLAGLDL